MKIGYLLLVATPIVVTGGLAWRFFLPLPVNDYWDVLHAVSVMSEARLQGQLGFFWEPFVDQRMVFPKMLIHGLAVMFSNHHYGVEIALGFLAQLGVLALLLRARRAATCRFGLGSGVHDVVISALLFWPVILFRFQHHWYSTQYALAIFPCVASLSLLARARGRWRDLCGAMILATVGAWSHGTGTAFGLAVSLLLLGQPGWSPGQRIAWWTWSAAVLVSVFAGMPSRAALGAPSCGVILSHPWETARYFVETLSPPVVSWVSGLVAVGVGLASVAALARTRRLRDPAVFPWLAIFLWGWITAAATTLARGYPGCSPGYQYTAFAVVFWVAVFMLYTLASARGKVRGHAVS